MIVREIQLRVRYKETDKMGIVHHSNYVNYYEVARTEMLREFGTTYRTMEERGVMLPVHAVEMQFYRPAYYDDLLTVRISLPKLPQVRLRFEHEIFNEAGELLNTGSVELAFVDSQTRRPCRAPRWFVDLLAPYFSENK